ncbi:MAG: hypothetical protein KKD00_07920 [Gammaproteobacteria bacterium]|nr:hypothetical protein [Gammaproteobacteria bacterium]
MQDSLKSTATDATPELAAGGKRLWLRGLPCLILMAAVLYIFPLSTLNPAALALMVVIVSWCLYQYFLPLHLIRRHAMLEHVTSDNSVLRRWLWNGLWSKLVLLLWSIALAFAVLILLNGFSDAQWLILLAGIPVMLLMVPPALRMAGSETGERYHFPMALRVAVYLTITVTTLGLIVVQLLGEGVEDTRHLTLLQLVAQSWSAATETSGVREIGWLLGVEAVVNDAIWYLMQQASTLSEQSALLKLLAWLVFLLFVTLQAAVFWYVQAGVLSWVLGAGYSRDRLLNGARPARTFVSGMFALALLSYVLAQPGVTGFINALADRSIQALPLPPVDPCVQQLPRELATVTTNSAHVVSASTTELQQTLLAELEQKLDLAFALGEPAVDEYLDWNFSLPGQYAQLFFMAKAVAESGMDRSSTATLQQGIEQRVGAYMAGRIDDHVGAALAPQLQQTGLLLQEQFAAGAEQVYLQQAFYIEEQLNNSNCLQLNLPALATADLVHKSAVGVGPVAGLVAARIAARGGARVGANVLTRHATKRMVSAGAARVASKSAQSSGASGLGLTCGPLAPVCVPALFVATWIGTDLLINEIDESVNRAALRADLLAALDAEKQRLRTSYQDVLTAGVTQLMADVSDYREQRFRILEQGI